jgi:hypothetical protein
MRNVTQTRGETNLQLFLIAPETFLIMQQKRAQLVVFNAVF